MSEARASRGLELVVDRERAEAAIWRNHLQAPSPTTRTALFEHYRPLARRIAHREWHSTGGHGCEKADFEQLAIEGLLQAIDRFDALRETRFEAYARPRIRGCIRNELARASEASASYSHRKRLERDRLQSLRDAVSPSAQPLAMIAELAVKIALGAMLEERVEVEPDQLASDRPSAYETLAWNQLCCELDLRLAQLPENERFVLEQHYRHDVQFQQIAILLGLSKGRVSQLHAQGLDRLRRQMAQQR
jgi:RNA polymerase sigma factor for flagellar operon FliA